MFYNDHAPPHFHAIYGDEEALVSIADGAILQGALPRRALRLVRAWAVMYRDDLGKNWERASARPRLPLEKIPGLDANQ